MFQKAFSFQGRIRRSEFGVSMIIYMLLMSVLVTVMESAEDAVAIVALLYIALLWFGLAQGAKRCHDIGNSGWYQIIPFYGLFMLFQDGQDGANMYGENPKTSSAPASADYSNSTNSVGENRKTEPRGGAYIGGYDGGHNNPNLNLRSNINSHVPSSPDSEDRKPMSRKNDGYSQGDLYK